MADFFWRTKDGEEIDFVLETSKNKIHTFEAKLAIQNIPKVVHHPSSFQKQFSSDIPLIIVTFEGRKLKLSEHCWVLPIAELHDYLKKLE